MMRFTHSSGQHLQVGDASLYFEQAGNPGGKPLVLLHGGFNPAPNFGALVQAVVGLWTDKTATGYPGSDVTKIAAPTLIVRGDSDHLMPLHEAAKLRDQIEGAHFFNVPFSGHEAHKDAPELFLTAVKDFLAQPRKLEREA